MTKQERIKSLKLEIEELESAILIESLEDKLATELTPLKGKYYQTEYGEVVNIGKLKLNSDGSIIDGYVKPAYASITKGFSYQLYLSGDIELYCPDNQEVLSEYGITSQLSGGLIQKIRKEATINKPYRYPYFNTFRILDADTVNYILTGEIK